MMATDTKQEQKNKNAISLFSPVGSVNKAQLTDSSKVAYITISEAYGDNIILGYAPITGVDIKQLTDYSVTKSLFGDFLVSTFGDTPVMITLRGLNFFNINGCLLTGQKESKTQIMDFYKENRVSSAPSKRFDISIATSSTSTSAFRCVIVGLDTQNMSTDDGISNILYNYTMTLIGVDRE
jgi:hypothetical protein